MTGKSAVVKDKTTIKRSVEMRVLFKGKCLIRNRQVISMLNMIKA